MNNRREIGDPKPADGNTVSLPLSEVAPSIRKCAGEGDAVHGDESKQQDDKSSETFFKVPAECLMDLQPDETKYLFGLLKCVSKEDFNTSGKTRFSVETYPTGFQDVKFNTVLIAGVDQCQQQLLALGDVDVVTVFMDRNKGFAGRHAGTIRASLLAAARGACEVRLQSVGATQEMPKDVTFMIVSGPIPSLIVACFFLKKILGLAISTATNVSGFCKRLGLPVCVHIEQDSSRNILLKSFYSVVAGASYSTSSTAKDVLNVPLLSLVGDVEDPSGKIKGFVNEEMFTKKFNEYYHVLSEALGKRQLLPPCELEKLKDGVLHFLGSQLGVESRDDILKFLVFAIVLAERGYICKGLSAWSNHAFISHQLRLGIFTAKQLFPFFKGMAVTGVFERLETLKTFLKAKPFVHKLTHYALGDEVVFGEEEPGFNRRKSMGPNGHQVLIRQTDNWRPSKNLLEQVINSTNQVFRLYSSPNNRIFFDLLTSSENSHERPQVGAKADGYELNQLQVIDDEDVSATTVVLSIKPTNVIQLLQPMGDQCHLQRAVNFDVESVSSDSRDQIQFFHPGYMVLVDVQMRSGLVAD